MRHDNLRLPESPNAQLTTNEALQWRVQIRLHELVIELRDAPKRDIVHDQIQNGLLMDQVPHIDRLDYQHVYDLQERTQKSDPRVLEIIEVQRQVLDLLECDFNFLGEDEVKETCANESDKLKLPGDLEGGVFFVEAP